MQFKDGTRSTNMAADFTRKIYSVDNIVGGLQSFNST